MICWETNFKTMTKTLESKYRIPVPPVPPKGTLNKSINFWSEVLLRLDKKIQMMEENLGFGDIGITFRFYRGKITKIIWIDEITDLTMVKKGEGMNSEIKEDDKFTVDKPE